ncbi:MAG: hypothetical protein GXP33_06380 [Spirochaetes bacterium]|nr:hypothetical protein [Spirochaetota bacterium]
MKGLKVFSLILISIFLTISAGFSQSAGASALKTYLNAMEGYKLKTAYNSVAPEEMKYKTFQQFAKENPVPFLKAMQMANKNFFKFRIVNEKAAEPNNIIVETMDIEFPDSDITYAQLYKILQMSGKNKKNSPSLTRPADILKIMRQMFKKEGINKIPFKKVKKKMSVIKVKNKWYVKPGWKAEAMAKKEKEQARELAQKAQRAEFDARSVVNKVNFSGKYIDLEKSVARLKELAKLSPESEYIKGELSRLTKVKDNYNKVRIKAVAIADLPQGFKSLTIEIRNESELAVENFMIEYSLLDGKDNVLKKVDDANIYGSDTLEPPQMGGLKPGTSGKKVIPVSADKSIEKWEKTQIKLKSIHFAR